MDKHFDEKDGPESVHRRVEALLASASRLCRMPVILHDYLALTRLPRPLREHLSGACMARKAFDNNTICANFCGAMGEVNRLVERRPDGRIHGCAFGLPKIAVPLLSRGFLAGVLHGGPYLPENREVDFDAMDDSSLCHLRDCKDVLTAVAGEIERLIRPWQRAGATETSRADRVLAFLNARRDEPPRLEELAERLNLSPSRARHLVREMFGKSFTELSLEIRLQRAAGLLTLTDQPLAEMAMELGFCDQSHFSKAFRQKFRCPPLQYRKRHRR